MHSIDGLQVDTSLQEQFKADGADRVAIAKEHEQDFKINMLK